MAINKHMQAALRLLSYPAAADLEKVYKIERALYTLKSSPLSPLYQLRLLSYPAAADLEKVYKIERALYTLKSSPLSPLYHLWDQKIESIDGTPIRVRIYTPKQQTSSQLLLFFHGGGWVLESVDTYNQVCKALAKAIGCRIASVEYRRAPEFPFPVGLEDCYAAAKAGRFGGLLRGSQGHLRQSRTVWRAARGHYPHRRQCRRQSDRCGLAFGA